MDSELKSKSAHPLTERESAFQFIERHLTEDGFLKNEYKSDLPDDSFHYKDLVIRFSPGFMDSLGGVEETNEIKELLNGIITLLKSISKKNSEQKRKELYKILLEQHIISIIDPLIDRIIETNINYSTGFHDFARWLAFDSPDREPVKFGIALLGLMAEPNDVPKLRILGKHDEFALFVAVAFQKMVENPEVELWNLAKYVNGWGRIFIIERLSKTQHTEIKKWLLTEGFKNNIMNEYLAYTCAMAGELHIELEKPEIDEKLLESTIEILEALLNNGPSKDIDDYPFAARTISLFIKHIEKKATKLLHFIVLNRIKRFLEDTEIDWNEQKKNGWTEDVKANVVIDIYSIIKDKRWREIIEKEKNTTNDEMFYYVKTAARYLNIDLWDVIWNKLQQNPLEEYLWFNIMEYVKESNIQQIIDFALQVLPLDEIASGPADEFGLGQDFGAHRCLDFVLQSLSPFPGYGFDLIKVALKSKVTRNRNLAIKTLSDWGKDKWPEQMSGLLQDCLILEPNEKVKENLNKVIHGYPLYE
jgi:hypothetical protein